MNSDRIRMDLPKGDGRHPVQGPVPDEIMERCGFRRGGDGHWWGDCDAFDAVLKEIGMRATFPRPAAPDQPVDLRVMTTCAGLADLAAKIYGGGDDAA